MKPLVSHLFIAQEETAAELGSELQSLFPEGEIDRIDELTFHLVAEAPTELLLCAFSRQLLPNMKELTAPSINKWADALLSELLSDKEFLIEPWRLHIFTLAEGNQRRAHLIEERFREVLNERWKKFGRNLVTEERALDNSLRLVQLYLLDGERGFFSRWDPQRESELVPSVSPFPGGNPFIEFDTRPPARAYKKLLEAEALLGEPISAGDSAVDLGASPGSWTWVALDHGANVTAVDRTELREDIMHHPRLRFAEGDGFQFAPRSRVTWLLCDIIAAPQRSLELLEKWLDSGWCERFVVTLKFKGPPGQAVLEDARRLMASRVEKPIMRRLRSNKNEIVLAGFARLSVRPERE